MLAPKWISKGRQHGAKIDQKSNEKFIQIEREIIIPAIAKLMENVPEIRFQVDFGMIFGAQMVKMAPVLSHFGGLRAPLAAWSAQLAPGTPSLN